MKIMASTGKVAGLLHCATCSNLMVCNSVELLRYTQNGWPKCCGEVMPLYTASDKPSDQASPNRDTRFD